MRVYVRDEKVIVTVYGAELRGKQIRLFLANGIAHTNDYYSENTALGALTNLVVDGYIIVDTLHYEE